IREARILDDRRSTEREETAGVDGALHKEERRSARDYGRGIGEIAGGPGRWGEVRRAVGCDARKAAKSGTAVHHVHAATGGFAQTAVQREADDGAGAAIVRGRGDGERRLGRSHHLYAYRLNACFAGSVGRRARVNRAAVRS